MANARALDKRRKSIRNIRKITRTMELIATARYKKAMDRASAVTSYTDQITRIVSRLIAAGTEVDHPLLKQREKTGVARVWSSSGIAVRTSATTRPRISSWIESAAVRTAAT